MYVIQWTVSEADMRACEGAAEIPKFLNGFRDYMYCLRLVARVTATQKMLNDASGWGAEVLLGAPAPAPAAVHALTSR